MLVVGMLFEMYDGMRQINRMMQSNARPAMRNVSVEEGEERIDE